MLTHSINRCMYAGFAAMDFIRGLVNTGTQVETIVSGYCASAAVDIFLAGSRRLMGRNSYVLIHQLSVDIGGTYSTLKVGTDNKKFFLRTRELTCVSSGGDEEQQKVYEAHEEDLSKARPLSVEGRHSHREMC